MNGTREYNADADWWGQWALYHAGIFGRSQSESHLRMLLNWQDLFGATYTKEEIYEATKVMATTASPKYDHEHLPAFRESLRIVRQRKVTRKKQCRDCGGDGVVKGLPYKDGNVDVVCRCNPSRDRSAMSMDEYEKVHPDWRSELKKKFRRMLRELISGMESC